jgi:hypothetical protein
MFQRFSLQIKEDKICGDVPHLNVEMGHPFSCGKGLVNIQSHDYRRMSGSSFILLVDRYRTAEIKFL